RADTAGPPNLDVRAAAGPGPGHEVGVAVPVQVADRDVNTAVERRGVGVETRQFVAVLAAEDPHVRAAAGAGPGDGVGPAVAVQVAAGHEHAAGEPRVVGVEAVDFVAVLAVEDLDVRPAEVAGPGDDVADAVAGHV